MNDVFEPELSSPSLSRNLDPPQQNKASSHRPRPQSVVDGTCGQVERDMRCILNEPERDQTIKQRTSHRQARLVDGTILSKDKKQPENSPPVKCSLTESSSAPGSPARLSWTGTRQNSQQRQSWLQGVRSLFNNKLKFRERLQGSANNSHVAQLLAMSKFHRRVASGETPTRTENSKQHYPAGLDGAFDDNSPTKSLVRLDKPLPSVPPGDSFSKSILPRYRTPSFRHSQDTTDGPSTASAELDAVSDSARCKLFENTASPLIETDAHACHLESSPLRKDARFSRPDHCSLANMLETPQS